jgi:hypothetical protein
VLYQEKDRVPAVEQGAQALGDIPRKDGVYGTIPGIPKCTICKFGFMTKAMLISHLQQAYIDPKNEASNIHAVNMLNQGLLWQVDLKHIGKPVTRNLPTYAELRSASLSPRKDHIILVFRQSGQQLHSHHRYTDKLLHISTATVSNLRTITANKLPPWPSSLPRSATDV